jgi:predicted DNA-binding transcriptional regulator AlpA
MIKYLTKKQVAKKLNISINTVSNMVKNNRLPKPIYLSKRMPRWNDSLINKYINNA